MPAKIEIQEYYLPRKLFLEIGGFTSQDLSVFMQKHSLDTNPEGIPVFGVVEALNKERKKRRFGEDDDFDRDIKKEKLIKARIENQSNLKELIPIVEAKKRVKDTFLAVANMMRYAIKLAAPKVARCVNARDAENVLIDAYNNAIEHMEEQSVNISWENEGAKTKLGGTELVEDTEEDTSGTSN